MEKGKIQLTQKDAENTPAGGVVVGRRDGQTMIYDDASLGGYFVGKLHKDGGIKMVNKSTGQPLEVQGAEVIITAPAVNDQTKHNFNGKMMTNREILSKINSDGGGVSFAEGGDIPAKIHTADKEYEYGGKMVHDIDLAHSLGMNSTLKKGKQQFSSGDTTYYVDAIYNAIKKGKVRLKIKEVETFPMKYSVYDKNYAENHKIDFRKPNGITVRTESGEEVLIDGNHRMNNAYLKGRKTMKTYYIEDPKQIAKFTKKNKFELGGENNDFQKLIEEKFSEGYGKIKHFELNSSGGKWSYINNPNLTRSQRDKMPVYTVELANDVKDKATEIKKNYEISQPKEISILQFAEKFAKDNNGKIYHNSKSGSVYVRVKDKEIRISDHNILDRDSMNPKNRYDLEIIQRYFDEKTPSNLDYWTDEFKNGGHLSSGKSLKQIAEMHNVSLAQINEELTKGLEVEKEHFADFKERTRVAKDHLIENPKYYTILEKAGLKSGGSFDDGGSVSKKNEFAFNYKSNRLKSFYKTNNPSIDKLLIEAQPFIAELIEKQKELVLKETLENRGVAMPMSELDVEYYEIGLLYKMVQSFNKYLKVTDVLSDATIKKQLGLFEISATVTRDGKNYNFYTELIPAGGYNIQEFHYRYITKTDLPQSGENSAVENLKSKNTTLNKIKSIDLEIENNYKNVKRYKNDISNGFTTYKIQGVEKTRILDEKDIIREGNYLKTLEKEIEKLKIKRDDLESVFESLEKKGVGVNFGKEVKESIGRKLLDRLRASKYKETGDSLEFKIETRFIKSEKINTFAFTDEGNGLCSIKAGLELRGKYTLYDEYNNVPFSDIRIKINEIFIGEFEKYLKDGGHIQSQELVEKSKKGDTPARDLNNYNDIMDLEADGMVGMESGLAFADGGLTPIDANLEGDSISIIEEEFANGGGLELPIVSYVKVEQAGASLSNLINNKYNSYIEFAESVEYAYKQLGKKVRSFVQLQAFDENDIALINVSTYISDQKNTIKNFNPLTGNYKNLEKSLANSRPVNFKKFNWGNWLLSKVNPSSSSAQTSTSAKQSQYPEYYEFIGNNGQSFTKGKIYKINNPKNINDSSNFIDNDGFRNGFSGDNAKKFKPSTEQAFLAQQGMTSSSSYLPLDLSDTKVWIGDDERLSEAIQEVAFGLGWSWSGDKNVKYTDANYLVFNSMKFIGVKRDGREGFDANISREINPQDILLAKKPTITTSQTPASTSAKPFDFTDTKIDVSNRPDFRLKVQRRAFELGWEWDSKGGKTLDYDDFNYLYFTKTSFSRGNNSTSFANSPKREITEADIFGSQAPTSTTSTNKSVNNDVQSVLVTYYGGTTYTALNEERLLDKIKELWKDNDNSTMSINLQPQGNVQQLSTPLTVILDTIRTSKTSVQPSSLKNSELREYLSKDWYPELDWSYFFKEIKNTASNKDNTVDVVTLEYQLGKNYYDDKRFKTGEDLLEDFAKIEFYCVNNPDAIISVLITAEVVDKTGRITSKTERIDIGKNALKPSNFSYEEIKELIQEKWFNNQLDFSIFFKTNNISQTPTSNSAVPKTVENSVYNLDLAIKKLEKASSTVVTEYNKEIYDKSLKFLYETKATYELALKFTPESAFMYERLDILKKLAEIEKKIKNIEDMKKGGTFYMLAKILEKLERGENWKMLEQSQDVITNQIPQSEIEIIIRSQKFKNWFGDWEKALINNEYDNVSKALTDGIPSVYHHGARRIKYTYREVSNGVLYLAENVSYAIWFSQNATAQSEEGNYLTECFVNVKNPIDLTAFKVNQVDLGDIVRYVDAIYPMAKIYDYIPAQVALLIKTNQPTNVRMWAWQLIRKYAKFVNHIKENTPYDGFLYYENNPSDEVINPVTGQLEENVTKAVAIFKSHQVKVVDAVLFDGGLDDWRFENGGKIKN